MEKHSRAGKCRKQFTSCHYMDTSLYSDRECGCHHGNAATPIELPSLPWTSLHYAQRCSEIEPTYRSTLKVQSSFYHKPLQIYCQ